MSCGEATLCKIPLLDGDTESPDQIVSVESVSHDLERFRELYLQDEETFATYLYTAWGLLLRCFTGQDHVSFRTSLVSDASDRSTFAGTFPGQSKIHVDYHEDASLEACLKVTDQSRRMQPSGGLSNKPIPETSNQLNTHVFIKGSISASAPDHTRVIPESVS